MIVRTLLIAAEQGGGGEQGTHAQVSSNLLAEWPGG